MTTDSARFQDALFLDVLGADAAAVERAVIGQHVTGETDINKVVEGLAAVFKAPKRDLYAVLGVTSSKVSRRPTMNVDVLDRAGSAISLYARIAAMIGQEGAAEWFNQPNPHFGDKRPMDLLRSGLGRQKLAGLTIALEDGNFL